MRLSRLFILAGLAAAVYYLPRTMTVFPSGAGSNPADIVHGLQQLQLQSQAGAAEPGFGQLIEGNGNPNAPSVDFNQLIEAAEREPAVTGPQGSELSSGLQELAAAGAFRAPIIQKLAHDYSEKAEQARSLRDHVWDAWLAAQRWYLYNRKMVDLGLWTLPWALFLISLLTFALSHAGIARAIGELGYSISNNWLRVLSLTVIALSVATHSNPWPLIPRTLLIIPVLWLLASAYTLHLVDMNYPFWNSTLRGCLSPIASMVLIVLIQRTPAFLPA